MSIEIGEAIAAVFRDTHVPMVQRVFGDEGLDAVYRVMQTVKELYALVEPERIHGHVVVFQAVRPAAPTTPVVDFAGLANQDVADLCLEIAADGLPHAATIGTLSQEDLAKGAIVYHYYSYREEFLAGDERKEILRLDKSARSQFGVPTFARLRDALRNYANENVRESTCYIFRQAWFDGNRLFLKARPEALMRHSLTQFLRNRIGGDHDVWPEQNVNEKNPVDIRVQPRFSNNRLMIVEIKWLGDSVSDDGHVTASHRDSRAQDGADQLATYLDEQRQSAPSRVVQGYYVIVDARRKNLPKPAMAGATISRSDGLHYENEDLSFRPDHSKRPDFDPPYRMFARPVCLD